jgi:dTDP-4-amino-4,6-dideoxygalactose transaminase
MKINANALDRQFFMHQEAYEQKAIDVLRSGYYILGNEVKAFEQEFANYIGSKYCIGLANGLDALWISIKLLGIKAGDEVLVQSNTYIATVMGITMNGATPVFIEPNQYHNMDDRNLEMHITERTKAILVTHLYGQATNMEKIIQICEKYNLYLIEDCAQSHGAKYRQRMTGSIGYVGCFSFYPSKNLGCFGDGGAIVTNDEQLAEKVKTYRNYGSQKRYFNEIVGTNSRLDELQAGLLRVKLTFMDELTQEREALAQRLLNEVKNPLIELPLVDSDCTHVWHLFVIKTNHRDALMAHLSSNEIQSLIHYPIPPHLQEAYLELGYKKGDFPICEQLANQVLTLPLYNGMTKEELDYLIDKLNQFKG